MTLTREEIEFLVRGIMEGYTTDYQLAAWAMAVYFQGMTPEETRDLTLAMLATGEVMTFPGLRGGTVDKHSTGGVGDKTTLIVMAVVCALGVPVIKMSGRGLGYTGGTIDKLEAIHGFRTELSREEIVAQANRIQAVLVGQTGDLAPADKKLYAVRDVTATVDCLPLIASSVMCKKLASGAEAIVLDVKVGGGAFMRQVDAAVRLAECMVDIGRQAGRRMMALVTDMDQPLGRMVGNALEIREVIEVLQGRGPEDLVRLSLELAAAMLVLNGAFPTVEAAARAGSDLLRDGRAYGKFLSLVRAQGGQLREDDVSFGLPEAQHRLEIEAPRAGYVRQMDAGKIGQAAMVLGAGREKLTDAVDPAVGVELLVKVGAPVRAGEPLARLHYNAAPAEPAAELIRQACQIGEEPPQPRPLIHQVIM
jgi:pyrimidine-nucleoside phosphorylase